MRTTPLRLRFVGNLAVMQLLAGAQACGSTLLEILPANSVRVSEWLGSGTQGTHDGYCAKPAGAERTDDCVTGSQGSFNLSDGESSSRRAAAHACLLSCSSCAQCRYISVSSKLKDCSWCAPRPSSASPACESSHAVCWCARTRFHECKLGELRRDVSGFISGAVAKNTKYTMRRQLPLAAGNWSRFLRHRASRHHQERLRRAPITNESGLASAPIQMDNRASKSNQTVLFVMINNPNSISHGAGGPLC